jgi:hypothetical protein
MNDLFAIALLFSSPVLFGLLMARMWYRVMDALGMIE